MKLAFCAHKYSCPGPSHARLLTYCCGRRLLSCYDGRLEWLQQKLEKPKIVYNL